MQEAVLTRRQVTRISQAPPNIHQQPLLSASSSPAVQQQRRVGSRSHLRSSLIHLGKHTKHHHKIDLTIVAGLERPARHTTDNFASPASPATTPIVVCNLLSNKSSARPPTEEAFASRVSQSARPHGKDVQAMALILVFLALD